MKMFQNTAVKFEYNEETVRPVVKELDSTVCFCYTQEEVLNICLEQPFPGSKTYPSDHPIWTGYSGKNKTPLDAWKDKNILTQAIRNWFYMICFNELMIAFNPDNRIEDQLDKYYRRYNDKWGKSLIEHNYINIAREVLNRFTVAKLAPKVTAITSSDVFNTLESNHIDISTGVYSPMSGFNGIPEGAMKWAKKHNKNIDIECYDINPVFCNYFGYTQRDVTAQHIITEKTVICCPPYSNKDEKWIDTPDTNAAGLYTYCGFLE